LVLSPDKLTITTDNLKKTYKCLLYERKIDYRPDPDQYIIDCLRYMFDNEYKSLYLEINKDELCLVVAFYKGFNYISDEGRRYKITPKDAKKIISRYDNYKSNPLEFYSYTMSHLNVEPKKQNLIKKIVSFFVNIICPK